MRHVYIYTIHIYYVYVYGTCNHVKAKHLAEYVFREKLLTLTKQCVLKDDTSNEKENNFTCYLP